MGDLEIFSKRDCHSSLRRIRKETDGEKYLVLICSQVAERIDDAPFLYDYIKRKVSEPLMEMFFFNSAH